MGKRENRNKMFLRRSFALTKFNIRVCSTSASEVSVTLEDFRTLESNPTKHEAKHLGRFYTISPEEKKQLFTYGGLPKKFAIQTKTFAETCLMVREPAVEIIKHLNNTNFNKPTNRFVLYGRDGAGRSLTMAHILHYGLVNDFILVHISWVADWFKKPKETSNSQTKEGFIDINLDAAAWLVHFKTQNTEILAKLDLKCSREYVWSIRESTPAGAPLTDLIEHGVNRVKFATDTISVLLDELKQQSTEGKCKTMVAIDGFNAFFHPKTRILGDQKAKISPDKVTITAPFLNITNCDWNNGVCLLIVDRLALTDDRMASELPKYQLRRTGFEHLDPFIPIRVDNYTDEEYHNCYEYYLNRKWIQLQSDGLEGELDFLSGKNPYRFMEICAPL